MNYGGVILDKRYQIFISSTYKDLIEERQKVTQAILKLYHFPIGMEMFHADNNEQWCQIKNTIDMSDYYILIVGRYCGTLIEKEGISYTEKEYDYAISRGIPVLSFIISDDAKKESYGIETNKQQRAYKKFVKKVMELPCEFWHTSDELAYQVTSTLSMKFRENNRNGWMPNNPYGIIGSYKVDDVIVGDYMIVYFSELKGGKKHLIISKMNISPNGTVVLYNNIRNGKNEDAEYSYHGICKIEENIIYIYLNNDFSNEKATIYFMRPVGDLGRYIGLFLALSSNLVPICIKIACFRDGIDLDSEVNKDLLKNILMSNNVNWENNMLIVEEQQKHLFYSDEMIMRS